MYEEGPTGVTSQISYVSDSLGDAALFAFRGDFLSAYAYVHTLNAYAIVKCMEPRAHTKCAGWEMTRLPMAHTRRRTPSKTHKSQRTQPQRACSNALIFTTGTEYSLSV